MANALARVRNTSMQTKVADLANLGKQEFKFQATRQQNPQRFNMKLDTTKIQLILDFLSRSQPATQQDPLVPQKQALVPRRSSAAFRQHMLANHAVK